MTCFRQAFSFGLFALHLAFISFSLCIDSFTRDGFTRDGFAPSEAAAAAGAVWAKPVESGLATSTAGKTTNPKPRHFDPLKSFINNGAKKMRDAPGWRVPQSITQGDQKILTALSKVFQTPHNNGIPTKSQNRPALASRPPLPMPNEPCWIPASVLAVSA